MQALYVAMAGEDRIALVVAAGTRQTVACFKIDRGSGRLSSCRPCVTQHIPQELRLSEDGARLFVVGMNGQVGNLSVCEVVGISSDGGGNGSFLRSFQRLEISCALKICGDGGNPVVVLPLNLGEIARL